MGFCRACRLLGAHYTVWGLHHPMFSKQYYQTKGVGTSPLCGLDRWFSDHDRFYRSPLRTHTGEHYWVEQHLHTSPYRHCRLAHGYVRRLAVASRSSHKSDTTDQAFSVSKQALRCLCLDHGHVFQLVQRLCRVCYLLLARLPRPQHSSDYDSLYPTGYCRHADSDLHVVTHIKNLDLCNACRGQCCSRNL